MHDGTNSDDECKELANELERMEENINKQGYFVEDYNEIENKWIAEEDLTEARIAQHIDILQSERHFELLNNEEPEDENETPINPYAEKTTESNKTSVDYMNEYELKQSRPREGYEEYLSIQSRKEQEIERQKTNKTFQHILQTDGIFQEMNKELENKVNTDPKVIGGTNRTYQDVIQTIKNMPHNQDKWKSLVAESEAALIQSHKHLAKLKKRSTNNNIDIRQRSKKTRVASMKGFNIEDESKLQQLEEEHERIFNTRVNNMVDRFRIETKPHTYTGESIV